jgi:hypothetical protein
MNTASTTDIVRISRTIATGTAGRPVTRACTNGFTYVKPVAWHGTHTSAMHHHRRPEEVASH